MIAETLYGVHPVLEMLRASSRRVLKVLLTTQRQGADAQRIMALAAQRGVPVEIVGRAHLHDLLGHELHQGVAALVEPLAYQAFHDLLLSLEGTTGPCTLLILDGVTDVGNFAALIRSAVAFGVKAIILPRHRSVALTPAVAKRSAGAVEHIMIVQVANIVRSLDELKRQGFWVYGTDMQAATPVAHVTWPERLVITLGAEGSGMRRLVRERCDELVRIPMRRGVDSLNVAIAGAIVLAYSWDQRQLL